MRIDRRNTARVYAIERRLFYAGLSCVLMLTAAYIYFVSASIADVVMRKELSKDINTTELHISELETSYIEAKDGVTEDMAASHGFKENQDRVFVERKPANLSLLRNDEG